MRRSSSPVIYGISYALNDEPSNMKSSLSTMAPSVARLFAPSLRCQAQISSLPTLHRTFVSPIEQPRLRLGNVAPNFKAKTTQGDIDFHEWLGDKWGILFSHPADFTPVCTTELGAFAKMKEEFEKRSVKMIGLVRSEHICCRKCYTPSLFSLQVCQRSWVARPMDK